MIDREHELPACRQVELLDLSRGCIYYIPTPVSEADLDLMRRIDALHMDHPSFGARQMRDKLRLQGIRVGRRHVGTLMRRMAIEPQPRKRETSKRNPAHKVYPYLLRGMRIDRPNQVWASDITYIPMRHGFLYLCAVIDWRTRRILAWRLSNTLTADFCIAAAEAAIARYGRPEIFNTDQGSQFTDGGFAGLIERHGIRLSMDGKAAWRDNIIIERLWRTLKYEEVYLRGYESGSDARRWIERYMDFYNTGRPHSSLGGQTPDMAYYDSLPSAAA
jgi:putative transposase